MNQRLSGYITGILAAAFYGMNPLFAIPLYAEGMSAESVLFFRYLIALPILALIAVARGQKLLVAKPLIPFLFMLGMLLSVSSLGLFLSYRYMDAGIASSLLFVYPLMVALIMAAIFHEKITLQTTICLIAALAGIYLLYHGGDGKTLNATGVFWIMVSSLSYAVYIVVVNLPKFKDIPTIVLTFYVILFGILLFIISLIIKGEIETPQSVAGWGCVIGLSTIPTALSLIFTTVAIQRIGSTPTALLGVFEPVTAVFTGVLIFGEILTIRDIAGLLLLMGAVCYVVGGSSLHLPINRMKKLFPRKHSQKIK